MVNNSIRRRRSRSRIYKQKYKKIPRKIPRKTPRKRDKLKGRGQEDELPFLLKKRLEKQGIYEPGIVSEMLRDVTRNSVKTAISRKHLMDSYKKYRDEKKVQADSMKEKRKKNKRRIEEIDLLLNKPEIMQTDAPSRSTRSQTKLKVLSINKSQSSNEYKKLISEKERLINENSSITYILDRRFRNL